MAVLTGPATPVAAQQLNMRPATMELEGMHVAEFARSLQVYTRDGEPWAAICVATLYDSEGEASASYASDQAVQVGGGEPAGCWSADIAEMIPGGRLTSTDRLLNPGLIVNVDYLTAHEIPVTVDHPIDPFLLTDELRFSTPRFDSAVEEVGKPMESRFGMSSDVEWVALTFVMIPLAERRYDGDSGGPLSEEFESNAITVLLGSRDR